jgi:RimJ/RimL family protein N-acetyltransferase
VISAAPALTGARVSLRPYCAGFTDQELAAIYRWGIDPEVLRLSGGSKLDMGFNEFCRLFAAQSVRRNSDHEQLFVILTEQGRLIGRTGLFAVDGRASTAELGIVIGEHDCWGCGYGRDAVQTLVEYGFRRLGLRRIILHAYPENCRAQRAFTAAGFCRVGERRRFSLDRGVYTEIEMEIRTNEYELSGA